MKKQYYCDINNNEQKNDDNLAGRLQQDRLVCAIKTQFDAPEDKEDKYEIRIDSLGSLYNPNDVFYDKGRSEREQKTKSGPTFIEVTKPVFDLYVKFLNSYRVIYLKQAENLR